MPPRASLARAAVSNSPRPFLHHASAPARYQHHHHNYHTNATLTGHHVLITGGSRGIGKAIATRFASLNASTTIIGRHAESLQTAVQEITTTSPEGNGAALPSPTHGYITGDISTKGFWEMLVRSLVLRSTLSSSSPSSASPQTAPEGVEEEEGPWHASAFAPQPVTILVNAAGVAHNALLIRQNAAAAENVVQTNLMGTLWGCRLLGKVLVAGRARRSKDEEEGTPRVGRSIVNVSSLLAIQGGVGAAAYAASKAGVLGMYHVVGERRSTYTSCSLLAYLSVFVLTSGRVLQVSLARLLGKWVRWVLGSTPLCRATSRRT